jgi:predicted amidohydrolase
MKVKLVQAEVSNDVDRNLGTMISNLEDSNPEEWVIFPEGMLSGYDPENPDFLNKIDFDKIQSSIEILKKLVQGKRCKCLFGTAYRIEDQWFNSVIILSPDREALFYHKNNLAYWDRVHFTQGSELSTFQIDRITFGIQMCREIVFPEQWKVLKHKGAQIIFHINNVIEVKDSVWSHLLISRAFENQCFVCSVNNCAFPQTLPSYQISPLGEVIYKSKVQTHDMSPCEIDLKNVTTNYLIQERTDLAKIQYL